MGVIIKHNKLFIKSSFFLIVFICIAIFSGCSDESASSGNSDIKPSADSEQTLVYSDDSQNIELLSEEAVSSEEESIDVEAVLNNAIQNTLKSENFEYDFKTQLSLPEISADLSCLFIKNKEEYSSVSIIKSNESIIYESKNYFSESKAFIDDKIIGKSKFICEHNDFLNFIKADNLYYSPLSSAKNIIINDNYEFQGDFTEQIIEEKFYISLLNALSIDESYFDSGNFTLNVENDFIKKIEGNFTAKAFFDEIEIPIEVNFTIDFLFKSTVEKPLVDEYIEYDSMKAYLLSKSLQNLALNQAYETYSQTRFYIIEKNNKEHIDISSNFATSFISQRPMMSYCVTASKDTNLFYEKYIHDGQNYERYYTEDKDSNYNISDADISYSQINSLEVWNAPTFNLSEISEYSIEETEVYYIISFEYNGEKALEQVKTYCQHINKLFNDLVPLSAEIFSEENLNLEKATGVTKIRKEDFIIIEQTSDIKIKLSDDIEIQILSSFEVMALNEDVLVSKPNV